MPRVRLPAESGPGRYQHRDGLSVEQGETADVDEEMAEYLVEEWGFKHAEATDVEFTETAAADDEVDLEDKTVDELSDLAAEAEIEGRSNMNKDELIGALRED